MNTPSKKQRSAQGQTVGRECDLQKLALDLPYMAAMTGYARNPTSPVVDTNSIDDKIYAFAEILNELIPGKYGELFHELTLVGDSYSGWAIEEYIRTGESNVINELIKEFARILDELIPEKPRIRSAICSFLRSERHSEIRVLENLSRKAD